MSKSLRCKHCGQLEEDHEHAFEAATVPAGCKCDPSEWLFPDDVPPVCVEYDGDTRGLCATCDHQKECHGSMPT